MERKSGVYWFLSDDSMRAGGNSQFEPVIVGFSPKGPVGRAVNLTGPTLEALVGYDIQRYPEMLGLARAVGMVTRLKFLRLNADARHENVYFTAVGSEAMTRPDVETADQLGDVVGNRAFWATHTDPGVWGVTLPSGEVDGVPPSFPAEVGGFALSLMRVATQDTAAFGPVTDDLILTYHRRNIDGEGNVTVSVVDSWRVSFNPGSPNFWGKVNFGDLTIGFGGAFSVDGGLTGSLPAAPFMYGPVLGESGPLLWLSSGSNGRDLVGAPLGDPRGFFAADMDAALQALDQVSANIICLNGITEVSVINSALRYGANTLRVVFCDTPDFNTFQDTASWRENLFATEYGFLASVTDTEMTSAGPVVIWPSLKTLLIYIGMFNSTGTLNHPPAGYRFGAVGVSRLRENDFYKWGDELKTAQINYFKVGERGPVLWEMNNLYALRSDLRKIHTVFVLLDLRAQILDFLANFTFRVMLPIDLLNLENGLRSIIGRFVQRGFLFGYALSVPSFAEAQAAGTVLEVPLRVAVNQASEEIEMRVSLRNAMNLNS